MSENHYIVTIKESGDYLGLHKAHDATLALVAALSEHGVRDGSLDMLLGHNPYLVEEVREAWMLSYLSYTNAAVVDTAMIHECRLRHGLIASGILPFMTIDAFESFARSANWIRSQIIYSSEEDQQSKIKEVDGEEYETSVPVVFGFVGIESTFGEIKITRSSCFSYDKHQPETFSLSEEGLGDIWYVEGLVVLDEDGDMMSPADIGDYLPSEFAEFDEDDIRPATEYEDIDMDAPREEHEEFTLERDNKPAARFVGRQIAGASSRSHEGPRNTRWTEIDLYQTAGGTLIAHVIGRTRWVGETDRYSTVVATNHADLVERLGYGGLAKEIYSEAGIDASVTIE